ncbi:hypothetical protein Dhaf_1936 [Desulfitobacterium hafniense DCB-2]|uniref:Uncharacterized protein n=1 Tax=Desulfitobacterium hafniense (strain DSM 10664 / DCB-2) TaxID=272564 RepID=B8FR61_DESHD|nr:hypothetical protein Dhaf_1936 [Desulfitobacterium hafniense DCB-2]
MAKENKEEKDLNYNELISNVNFLVIKVILRRNAII